MLFNFDPPVTDEEIRAASLHRFVRKISGFNKPSKANEPAFLVAIEEVAAASTRLLHSLETTSAPRNREEEAAKAKARGVARFGDLNSAPGAPSLSRSMRQGGDFDFCRNRNLTKMGASRRNPLTSKSCNPIVTYYASPNGYIFFGANYRGRLPGPRRSHSPRCS